MFWGIEKTSQVKQLEQLLGKENFSSQSYWLGTTCSAMLCSCQFAYSARINTSPKRTANVFEIVHQFSFILFLS